MERLSSLSLVTQQISVKGGTGAPGYFWFKTRHLARGHLNPCTGAPRLGSVCHLPYLVRSAQDWIFQYPGLPRGPFLLSCFCCLDEVRCSQYFLLHSGIHHNAPPDALAIRCGGDRLTKGNGRCSSLWTSDKMELQHFTVVLHSNVFNGK